MSWKLRLQTTSSKKKDLGPLNSFIRSLSCSFSCQFNLIMHKRQVLMKPNNLQLWICLPIHCENFHWFLKWVGNYWQLLDFSFFSVSCWLWPCCGTQWKKYEDFPICHPTQTSFLFESPLWFPEVTAHTSLICQKSRKFNHTKSLHWIPIQEE